MSKLAVADGHRYSDEELAGLMRRADLDADGRAEIVLGGAGVNADGTVRWNNNFGPGGQGNNIAGPVSAVVDLDLDGVPEVLAGRSDMRQKADQRVDEETMRKPEGHGVESPIWLLA